MALGHFRAHREIEMRQAAVLTPPAQARCKALVLRHEYLPGSCANAAVAQHAIGARGATQEAGGERMDRGRDRTGLELPRRVSGGGYPLSRRPCPSNHPCPFAVGKWFCLFASDPPS